MRVLTILGALLLVLGGLILSGQLSRKSSETVLEVGDLKAEVEGSEAFPKWTGVLALVAGVGLIAAGARKKA
ncbi:MAG TPA: hypothetical protein VLA95_11120 [Gemmatimonadales bacterium]|nr:hypothetical protein [Gemmatimonadales bacterium]